MEPQTGGRLSRVGLLLVAFAFACLAAATVFAGELEREIPVFHDGAGSRFTVEISREETHETATPCLLLNDGSLTRASARLQEGTGTAAPGKSSVSPQDAIGTILRAVRDRIDEARASNTAIEMPKEITARSVRNLLRSVKASAKPKRAAATASRPTPPAHPSEGRFGMARNDTRDIY